MKHVLNNGRQCLNFKSNLKKQFIFVFGMYHMNTDNVIFAAKI